MTGGLDNADWLEGQFASGRSVVEVAAEIGVTPRAVRYAAHRMAVVLPQLRTRLERQRRLEDPDWLRRQRNDGVTVTEVAHTSWASHATKWFGVSTSVGSRVVTAQESSTTTRCG